MRIVWDEPKRLANIDKHDGVDLAGVTEEFLNEASSSQPSLVVLQPLAFIRVI